MPLVALDHIAMAYGHLPLLDDASLLIETGERVCVIGRNGTGKSTLLQIISGDVLPDGGSVWCQPALRIARLELRQKEILIVDDCAATPIGVDALRG